jgi:hypothetical protein
MFKKYFLRFLSILTPLNICGVVLLVNAIMANPNDPYDMLSLVRIGVMGIAIILLNVDRDKSRTP